MAVDYSDRIDDDQNFSGVKVPASPAVPAAPAGHLAGQAPTVEESGELGGTHTQVCGLPRVEPRPFACITGFGNSAEADSEDKPGEAQNRGSSYFPTEELEIKVGFDYPHHLPSGLKSGRNGAQMVAEVPNKRRLGRGVSVRCRTDMVTVAVPSAEAIGSQTRPPLGAENKSCSPPKAIELDYPGFHLAGLKGL